MNDLHYGWISRALSRTMLVPVLGYVSIAGGCASQMGHRQLEKVAKDWSYAIRASQVMPVYPLTEDLRPGDVFLVQVTLQEQASIWKHKGFLALDDHRVRLPGIDFKKMYFDVYWDDQFGGDKLPHPRPVILHPGPLPAGKEDSKPMPVFSTNVEAPRAAFPTYSFDVSASTGLSLAVPVHGVPVGLNFMNASSATGSIAISDAYTYAADESDLYQHLRTWAEQSEVRTSLASAASTVGHDVILRVVSRVYLTGSVDVTLTNKDSTAGGAKVGAAPDLDLITPSKEEGKPATFNKDYETLIDALNQQASKPPALDQAGKLLPGGTVKFAFASRRGVSLSEVFDTPLAIGFLGFDVLVDSHGNLGYPIPTYQVVQGNLNIPPQKMGVLSSAETRAVVQMTALSGLLDRPDHSGPVCAARVVERLGNRLDPEAFAPAIGLAKNAQKVDPVPRDLAQAAIKEFNKAARAYLSKDGATGPRYDKFSHAFDEEFNRCDHINVK